MRKIGVIVLFGWIGAIAAEESSVRERIAEIDRKIEELQEVKNRCEARAAKHRDKASLWQFQSDLSMEVRREHSLEDQERDRAKATELKIRALRKEKAGIQPVDSLLLNSSCHLS